MGPTLQIVRLTQAIRLTMDIMQIMVDLMERMTVAAAVTAEAAVTGELINYGNQKKWLTAIDEGTDGLVYRDGAD